MLASDIQTVTDLNQRARAHRVRTGAVTPDGVHLADGTTAGVGDVIVTRLNGRALATGRGWVKNGDGWIVNEVRKDRSLVVSRTGGGAATVLPVEYVSEHVELGYASTAHRAQGRTLDTTHAYVAPTTQRKSLYVMASRGKESNRLYVDTANEPGSAAAHGDVEPVETLQKVIATSGTDLAAHEVRRRERARAQPVGVRPWSPVSRADPAASLWKRSMS